MNGLARASLVLILLATAQVCLATDIDQYRLDQLVVTGVGREYLHAVDRTGQKLEFATGSGRFFDAEGRRIQPDDDLRREDVLFAVYRATDPSPSILSAVLGPRPSETQAPLPSPNTATRGQVRLSNGASLMLARGWRQNRQPGDDSLSCNVSGRLSMLFLYVEDTDRTATAELLPVLEDTAPEAWGLLGSRLTRLQDSVFAHQRAVALLQWDRGFEWVNHRTGERTPAASPVHELDLVDRFAFCTIDGKLLEARSYIPVQEFSTRIREVCTMVATLRVQTEGE